jgi:hypothetical protein
VQTVEAWLEALGLGRYAEVFARNEVTPESLALLTPADVAEMIAPVGPRRVVLAALERLQRP